MRRVDVVMQTDALTATTSHLDDEERSVDGVAEFAERNSYLRPLVEFLGLVVEDIETVEGAVHTEIAADDAHIVGHYLLQLLESLCDEHLLLVDDSAFVVPFGDVVTKIEILNQILGMFH